MLCARSDESGSYEFDYDAFGNLISQTFTETQGIAYTQSYVYDDGDQLIQMTLPFGRVIEYTRDGVRRVSAIDTTVNGAPQTILSAITYRGDNQMLQRTLGNGLIDARSYDLQGRLLSQQLHDSGGFLVDDRTYSYDRNSNILNIATNLEQNAYGYDKLDRIINDTVDTAPVTDYTYDQNDNRLTRHAALDAAASETIDELIEHATGTNRIQIQDALSTSPTPLAPIPNRDLIYNDAGRLYQLFEEGVLKAEYLYNDAGQRTSKTVYQPDGLTIAAITVYHYDQQGYLITETDDQGNLIKDYLWLEGMIPVAQVDNTLGTEQVLYLTTDHLMTNRLATDQTQAVVWRWEGEAFGNTPAEELAGYSINLRFPGQYFDEETNLHYNLHRYYSSELGRYLTSDPVGIAGDINTYNYAISNSVRFTDQFGLSVWMIPIELGCKILQKKFEKEEKAWDERLIEYYRERADVNAAHHRYRITACIEAYEYHQDECKFEECMRKALEGWNKENERIEEFVRQGRVNNPYRTKIICIFPPKGPKR